MLAGPDLVLFVGASAIAAVRGSRVWAAVACGWTTVVSAALLGYALIERAAGWGAVLMVLAAVGTGAAALTLWRGELPVHWFFTGPFAFRAAGQARPAQHLLRSLVQLVVFWTVFFVGVPVGLSWTEARLRLQVPQLQQAPWPAVGMAVFLVASALGVWSCVCMALRGEGTPLPAETARKLVVAGPYRFVRNPMAVAGLVQTIGVGFGLGSWMVMASAVAGAALWNTFIRPEEEADLARRFGVDFESYRCAVRCWIPRVPTSR